MSEIQVTAAQLRAKAEELGTQNANTAFHTAFQRDKTQFTNFFNAIQQYIQVLQNVAARYAQAESQNIDIATTRTY